VTHNLLTLAMVGCHPPAPAPPQAARAIGTHDPYKIVVTPPDGRWSLVCQARTDTDHDGKIAAWHGFHGDWTPIVRELATGKETALPRRAFTARWSSDGSWVEAQSLAGDTNRDGYVITP
jgi:hypothetical protein